MSILPPQDILTLRNEDLVSNIEGKMDGLKPTTSSSGSSSSGVGADLSRKSGEEPLSGVKGQGTVEEPFDQGNAAGEFFFFSRSFFVMGGWLVLGKGGGEGFYGACGSC